MANIIFYEKPGCINNSKQKVLLSNAGHHVDARNLLTESWSKEALLPFFDGLSVTMWFNVSAPDIKSGQIDPSELSEEQALELMIQNPILIRRPLMRVGDDYRVGFEPRLVDEWIGLTCVADSEDLESCPQQPGHACNITGQ